MSGSSRLSCRGKDVFCRAKIRQSIAKISLRVYGKVGKQVESEWLPLRIDRILAHFRNMDTQETQPQFTLRFDNTFFNVYFLYDEFPFLCNALTGFSVLNVDFTFNISSLKNVQ